MSYKNHIDHELLLVHDIVVLWGDWREDVVNSYCSATVELMSPELLLASLCVVALQLTGTSPALATVADLSSVQVVEEGGGGAGAGHTLLADGSSLLTASSTTAA